MDWYLDAMGPGILNTPIAQLTEDDLLERLKIHEQAGALEKVSRVRTFLVRVFKYGKKHVTSNPAKELVDALASPRRVKHHAALFKLDLVGEFMRSMEAFRGDPSTCFIVRLSPHVFLRSHEIRGLQWTDVEWANKLLRIPGEKMRKSGLEHLVPLSETSLAILTEALPWSGPRATGKEDGLIFPTPRAKKRMLSENAMNSAYRRMGWTKDQVTHHGLRRTASSLLRDACWHRSIVEKQLAHEIKNKVEAAYNSAELLDQRREMMDDWSAILNELRDTPPGKQGLYSFQKRKAGAASQKGVTAPDVLLDD